jgi:hypothetical protein
MKKAHKTLKALDDEGGKNVREPRTTKEIFLISNPEFPQRCVKFEFLLANIFPRGNPRVKEFFLDFLRNDIVCSFKS